MSEEVKSVLVADLYTLVLQQDDKEMQEKYKRIAKSIAILIRYSYYPFYIWESYTQHFPLKL